MKTILTEPFGKWRVLNDNVLIRESGKFWVNVHTKDFQVWSGADYSAARSGGKASYGYIGMGSSLQQALTQADAFIEKHFEVEKTVEEQLKDAQAEIVSLKSRVTELEDGSRFRFSIGQDVRLASSQSLRTVSHRKWSERGDAMYGLKGSNLCIWAEKELEPA